MNNGVHMPEATLITPLTQEQRDCIEVLEQTLEQAKLGNVTTIGMALCMKNGWTHIIRGTQAGDLYLATGSMMQGILAEVTTGNVKRRGRLI